MIRRIHRIILLFVLLLGCAGMNYVEAANVTLTVTASPAAGGQVRIANGSWTTSTNGTTSRSVAQSTPMGISAQAASGYTFSQWNDGNKNASRAVQITKNTTYTATFIPNTVTLTVTSNNTNYGTVTGGGTYNYGTSVTIKATPKAGYHFVQWSDGNKNASRTVTATANASYQATFAVNQYTIKFVNNGTTLQTLTVNHGVKPSYTGSTPTKTATAQYTYTFSGWSPTIVAATADATYTAQFSSTVRSYTIRFLNGSSVLQTGSVKYGTTPSYTGATPTKSATVQYIYTFSGWSPTIYAVNKAQDYTAQFSSTVRSYKITGASANTAMGTVSGTATKQYNQTVTLTATPKSCYKFVQWNDGNTSNPRTVTVQGTATYTATFEETISGNCGANGSNVKWYFNACTGALRIVGTGAMIDATSTSSMPWYDYRASVTSVTIGSGVTRIGNYAFNGCSNLTTVTIPPSITSVGNYAFYECWAMESVYISDLAAWCNISFYNYSASCPFYRNCRTDISHGGGNLYVNGTKVTTLTIPNGITTISDYAFCGFAGITSIQFNQATTIGNFAISSCHGLTHVTIPEGVTTIGNNAFAYCTNLQSISIPASVTSLGSLMLYNCQALTDIYVNWTANVPAWPSNFTNKSPQSDITLHVPCGSGDLYRAANGWKNYTMQGSGTSNYTLTVKANNSAYGTVQIDDDAAGTTVTKSIHCEDTHTLTATGIGCHYFKQWNDGNTENPRKIGISANKTYTATFAEGLGGGTCGTNVTWYLSCDGVMTISGTGAMTNFNSVSMPWYALKNDIKSVVINSGVTSIGNYAFYNCINLTSVTIPSTVTTIRPEAFENCTSLTSVTIPSSVTSIGYYAFYNTGLTDIYVSWTTAEAIPGWSAMTQASQADNITLHVPCGSAEYYLAKAGWKTYTIRGGCNTTYTLTVASNNSAYGLVQMDNGTFAASISEQVYTDDSHRITAVPVDACHHFVQWEDGSTDNPRTVMPNTNTTYTATFTDQPYSGTCGTNLTWVLECDSTLRISGTGAMTNYSSSPWNSLKNLIKHVVIEEGVTTIGNCAFYQMDIVTVTNPSTLKTIGSQAFYRCHQLESINFPNGMTSIGSSVTGHGPFYECTSLKAIYIPASLTFINSDTFLRCYSLTSIVVDPANPKYDSRDNCNAIIETAINKLWYGCQTTVIPDGVKTVAQFAFEYQHNLKSIRISNTVTHFETSVFKECENLKDIYVEWTTTPPQDILTAWYEHENLDATIIIHVPCGYESLYSSSSAWNRYQIADDHLKGGMCGAQGSNQTWMLSCDGHLDIKGIGAMADYSAGSAPWNEYKDAIHTVTFADGINTIGENAFAGFTNLTDIYAPWTENIPVLPASNNPQPSVSLHVPCSAIKEYQEADGWKDYTIVTEYTASGTCGAEGDNLTWTLCDSTLTISGTGAMANWVVDAACPWYQYRTQIYTINIAEGVTTIGNRAFVFTKISSITIPNSVTSIGSNAFRLSTLLEEIVLPEGLNSIGDYAFQYGNVKTIHIPSSVTSLGTGAFEGCDLLKDIYVEWLSSIPEWHTFSKQYGVNLHIPCGTEELYNAANGWKNYTIEAEYTASGTCGAEGDNLTWTLCDSTLTISGTGAMKNFSTPTSMPWNTVKTDIKSIVINPGVTSVGANTFVYCPNLTSVSIPSSVTTIGPFAFMYCSSLNSVTIPNSVTSLGTQAFYETSSLTDIYVSWTENLPTWPSYFTNKSPQTDITLHVPCEAIELYRDATGWKNYNVAGSDIASGTCGADGNENNVTWSLSCDGVLTISGTGEMKDWSSESAVPWYAYKDAIRSVVINEGVTRIGSYAFKYCNKIINVSIPSSTTSIGIWAFDQCTGVEGLHISDLTAWCTVQFESFASNPLYYAAKPDLYVNDELIVNLVIPEGVTSIYKHAFQHCSAQTITLPEGLQIIGEGNASAFAYTTISSITIPQSVTYLGRWSFTDNDNLTDIYVYWTENIPAWNNMTNKSPQSSITLHVPCGTTSLYQAATGWKSYTIVEDMPNIKSGTYGPDNIEWTFDYCDSLLTITGNGELQCDQNTWGPNAGGINPNAVKNVFIGKGVTYLGIYTLSYMTNIEYIEIEEGHPTHRTGCNAIIRIGSEQEGDTLIFGCPHTVIPTTCTTIRGYAFWDNHRVTEMTIPSSVKQIANMQGSLWQGNNGQVFYTSNSASEGLKDLYVEWTKLEDIPAVPNNRLGDMTKVRLHVPCGTTSLYKQVTGWSKFKEYIEESATFTITVQAADPTMGDVNIVVNP